MSASAVWQKKVRGNVVVRKYQCASSTYIMKEKHLYSFGNPAAEVYVAQWLNLAEIIHAVPGYETWEGVQSKNGIRKSDFIALRLGLENHSFIKCL
jgi:hypothetical protein